MRTGAAFMAPGYLLLAEMSSQGGSTTENYKESEKEDEGRRISYTMKVDHPELEDMATKALSSARYTLYKHTARFFSGSFFVGEAEFEKVDRALDEPRKNAALCNRMAQQLKSKRVTIVNVHKFKVDVDDKRTALRLGVSIYDRLKMLRDSYTADSRRGYQAACVTCANMEGLVLGTQRELIRLALASADSQRAIMIAHYGGKKGVAEVLREYKGRLPDLDYGPIDAALEVFEPSVESVARGK